MLRRCKLCHFITNRQFGVDSFQKSKHHNIFHLLHLMVCLLSLLPPFLWYQYKEISHLPWWLRYFSVVAPMDLQISSSDLWYAIIWSVVLMSIPMKQGLRIGGHVILTCTSVAPAEYLESDLKVLWLIHKLHQVFNCISSDNRIVHQHNTLSF